MRYRPLGKSDIQASVIGLGAWAIGGWMWGGTDEASARLAIHAALDSGINLIDTAPAYGMGVSEEIVGRALKERRRADVVLATKCGLVWHTDRGQMFLHQDGKAIYRYLGPESVRYELEESLRRLGTDYIDLYQTHWQDPGTPIEDTMGALLELKREGKIRAIGVSNVTVEQLDTYRRSGPVDADQERYSMLDRGQEGSLLPYSRMHRIAFLAYSPLAHGLLTGKIGPEREFTGDDLRRNSPRFSIENRRRIARMLKRSEPIAIRHGLTTAQTVIAWTLEQRGVTHALAGARNPHQAMENAQAGDVVLTGDEIDEMNRALQEFEERSVTA